MPSGKGGEKGGRCVRETEREKREERKGEDAIPSSRRTVALHDLEELDNDLGARSDQDLALAGLLGVVDGVEGIVEDGSADHFGGIDGEILKSSGK
jgi:hypothetical protein